MPTVSPPGRRNNNKSGAPSRLCARPQHCVAVRMTCNMPQSKRMYFRLVSTNTNPTANLHRAASKIGAEIDCKTLSQTTIANNPRVPIAKTISQVDRVWNQPMRLQIAQESKPDNILQTTDAAHQNNNKVDSGSEPEQIRYLLNLSNHKMADPYTGVI